MRAGVPPVLPPGQKNGRLAGGFASRRAQSGLSRGFGLAQVSHSEAAIGARNARWCYPRCPLAIGPPEKAAILGRGTGGESCNPPSDAATTVTRTPGAGERADRLDTSPRPGEVVECNVATCTRSRASRRAPSSCLRSCRGGTRIIVTGRPRTPFRRRGLPVSRRPRRARLDRRHHARWRWQAGARAHPRVVERRAFAPCPAVRQAAALERARARGARRHFERWFRETYARWRCIHEGEGSWTANTGNGYFGGLQMSDWFMHHYGPGSSRGGATRIAGRCGVNCSSPSGPVASRGSSPGRRPAAGAGSSNEREA